MDEITRKPNRRATPKPKRKRRKKDLDDIHSKILKAKKKLDNVGNSSKDQKKHRKICNRLLPKRFAGIYCNGTKSKAVQKEKANIFSAARLSGDALGLLNGDTTESECAIKDTVHNEITYKQPPNEKFVKNNIEWTPHIVEQSPVLGKKPDQNQKICFVKKKGEENLFKDIDPNKIRKQNDEYKYKTQKKDLCKRRLFQNEKEQLENNTQIQIFDDIDLPKNRMNEKSEQICSENNKSISWDPLNRYTDLCAKISAENFKEDFLQNPESDPLTTTIKTLRQIYIDSYRQQLLRKKVKRELLNPESASSMKYQTCTYSDNLSSIEFEVPKCQSKIKNHSVEVRLQEDAFQKDDKFHLNLIQSGELKRSNCIMQCNSISCSSRDATYDTSTCVIENRENSDEEYAKPSRIHQPSKSTSFYFLNEKSSSPHDSRKSRNCNSQSSENNQYNKDIDSFYIDIPNQVNSQCVEKGTYILPNNSTLQMEKHLSKDNPREKVPLKSVNEVTAVSDNRLSNTRFRKYNDKATNKCNTKNVKRMPIILRRCGNVTVNKNNHIQINDRCIEGFRKREGNLFNGSLSDNITKEFHDTESTHVFKNLPSPNMLNLQLDRTKMLEPQIESMKIKDSQELGIEKRNINLWPDESNEKNDSCRLENFVHSNIYAASRDTNAHIMKLDQRQQIAHNVKEHLYSNNNLSMNYLQDVSSSNFEPMKQFPQQTRSQDHLYQHQISNVKQELFAKNTRDRNQAIFLKNVESRAKPMTTLDLPECSSRTFEQNRTGERQCIRNDKKCGAFVCEEIFTKMDAECARNHTNQNTYHCNEKYIYLDSANHPHKCNVSQTRRFHKETAQAMAEPQISYHTEDRDDGTDNCINLLTNMQNVQLLPLEQKYPYAHPHVVDGHHCPVILRDIAQPIKYFAMTNASGIQRAPVYANDGNIGIAENVPFKIVALMDTNSRTKTFPQEVTARIIPLQTNAVQFDDLAAHKKSNQPPMKHLDSVNAILLNSNLQTNSAWYPSSL